MIEQRIEEIRQQQMTQKTEYTRERTSNLTTYHIKARSVLPPEALGETKQLRDILAVNIAAEHHHIHHYAAMRRNSRIMDKAYTSKALIRMNSLTDLTCTSSSAILCAECFFLDQVVGRIEHGLAVTFNYYEGGQYGAMFNETMELFAYSMDENAPARLGDSPELPARFPWRYYSNWRILGDNTPNKLRFDDIFNMTSKIADDFGISLENSTLYNNIDFGSMNGYVLWVVTRGCYPIIEILYRIVLFLFSPTGTTDATASLSFVLNNWVICQWLTGASIDGSHTRFSIGESLFGYGVGYVGIMILFNGIFRINVWGIIASTGFAGTIFLFSFLGVTYNWAVLCWMSLPFRLLRDVNYFLVHTLLTKCDWVFSGLVKGPYTKETCASCAYTLTLEMHNCRDVGSRDLLTTVVFFLEYFAPWVIQWLRETSTPFYIIYQIPYVNERLNTYANVNMDDPDLFALHWTCNTTITLLPFLILGAFFLIIFKFVLPIFTIAWVLIDSLFSLAWVLFSINYAVLAAFSYTLQSYPYIFLSDDAEMDEEEEEEEDEDDSADDDNDDGNTYSSHVLASDTEIKLRQRRPYHKSPYIGQFTRHHQD